MRCGTHGHGEFVGMLLGSVSEHCVTHCHCPVVVIRGTGRRARRGVGSPQGSGTFKDHFH